MHSVEQLLQVTHNLGAPLAVMPNLGVRVWRPERGISDTHSFLVGSSPLTGVTGVLGSLSVAKDDTLTAREARERIETVEVDGFRRRNPLFTEVRSVIQDWMRTHGSLPQAPPGPGSPPLYWFALGRRLRIPPSAHHRHADGDAADAARAGGDGVPGRANYGPMVVVDPEDESDTRWQDLTYRDPDDGALTLLLVPSACEPWVQRHSDSHGERDDRGGAQSAAAAAAASSEAAARGPDREHEGDDDGESDDRASAGDESRDSEFLTDGPSKDRV